MHETHAGLRFRAHPLTCPSNRPRRPVVAQRRPIGSSLLLLVALALLAAPREASAQTILSDGDFTGWTELTSLSGSFTRLTTGGNPDAHLQLAGNSSLSSIIVQPPASSYDPGTSGALATIRFEADAIGTSGGLTTGQPAFGFCLVQSGDVFVGPVAFDLASWGAISTGELAPADFVNTLNPGQQPDFSAGGAPLEPCLVGASNLASGGFDFLVDNVVATVTPAPPPVPALSDFAPAALLGLLVAATIRRAVAR